MFVCLSIVCKELERCDVVPVGSTARMKETSKTHIRKPLATWLRMERALSGFDLSLSTAMARLRGQRHIDDLLNNDVYVFLDDSEPAESLYYYNSINNRFGTIQSPMGTTLGL